MTPTLLALGLMTATASAGDDLGSLLDGIPDIETTKPDTEQEAEDQKEADLDADLGQVGLPQYIDVVQAHLLGTMDLSKGVIKKHGDKVVRLKLKISSSGKISGMAALALSGDKKVDKKVIEAVREAAPLPVPPIVHRSDALRGVIISIPLGQVGG
mgnify:CR=1 FL=1|jgi:hypothetical protein